MKIKTKIVRKKDSFPGSFPHGYGNGYVGVPREHPWFGLDYHALNHIEVHGGLTFSGHINGDESIWWVGFDTAHFNSGFMAKKNVEAEVRRLRDYAWRAVNE